MTTSLQPDLITGTIKVKDYNELEGETGSRL